MILRRLRAVNWPARRPFDGAHGRAGALTKHRPVSTVTDVLPLLDPMLPVSGPLPADQGRHVFKPKWEGFRALVYVEARGLRVRSRRGTERADPLPRARGPRPGGSPPTSSSTASSSSAGMGGRT